MDDPLTKWLHLHSNINNTAGAVSARKNTCLYLKKAACQLFLKRCNWISISLVLRREIFSRHFPAIVRSDGLKTVASGR